MAILGDRRQVRRDRRLSASTLRLRAEQEGWWPWPVVPVRHASTTVLRQFEWAHPAPVERDFRNRRVANPNSHADLIVIENERLQSELRDHNARLLEVNKNLVITSVNAQILAEELRRAKAEMSHLAHHDHLTDLPNRIDFKEQLSTALEQARVHGSKLALLFIDLDRFKVVNDSLGHAIGDQLLQAVARRLSASVRHSDRVSRQGGDEFVAMLTNVAHADEVATHVANIHRLITAPYTIADHRLHIGASIGVSIFPDDVSDIDELIRNADIAMYSVKEQGRNSFAFFERPMNVRAIARHKMEVSLRRALDNDEFVLYYQAQFDLLTGRICGAEALIRWRHPEEGILLPHAFIDFAHECGVIKLIDRWVLREACLQANSWIKSGLALTVSVNISAQEFERDDFLEAVFSLLRETGLVPEYLELELLESAMMRDSVVTN
jgi:diguanylate cyclase (GGDEF)-like protein